MSSLAQEDSLPRANKECKILQAYHDDLVSQVSTIKLIEFSTELRRSVVISQEVNDVFAVLDDKVDSKLRLRYLLQHVCEGVKHDVTVFHRFIKALAGYGGHVKLLARRLIAELYGSESGAGPEGEAQADGTCRSQAVGYDISLLEDDIADLMEILVGVSYKWEELGIALHLPKAVREECRSASNNSLRLENILCKWLTGSYKRATPPTLKNLKQKLASELVGVVEVALSLEERFRESQKPFVTIPVTKTLESSLRIVYQSYSTQVADGKSTLLEVQISEIEAVCYQWMKNGNYLSDNQAYSGTLTGILAISPASQRTEGKYTCHIVKGLQEVISEVVLLTVNFSPEKRHLINLYSKDKDVPEESWPPKVTSTFINLALITKKKEVSDNYKYSIRGNVDDILETKEKAEFAAVFGEYKRGALVLVEGRPGSGKTTLVHKVARDWATGGEVLRNANFVFLIPLRSLANRKTEKLSDILDLFYLDRDECEKVVSDIKQSKGEGVCFIIDGLDEIHQQDENKSVIHQLLYNKYLPVAMVIVASRPVATDKLRRKPQLTSRIEVLGFSNQQILEYIDKYPFTSAVSKSDTSPSQLKAYLSSHHNLLNMCYLPIHVAMICFLYEHENGVIPPTDTQIYEHFTRFIVLRKQRRTNEEDDLGSLEDLCGEDKEYFSSVCHLAFEMTIHSTQTIHQRDTKVPLSLGADPNDTPSLGLLTIDRTAGLHRLDNTYTFLHLTFQEYLAAFYLAKLKEEEQMKMIRLHAGKKHMRVVWKFYCGIMKFDGKVAQIQSIIRSANMWGFMYVANLYKVQCGFESQQRVVCDSIVQESKGNLSYNKCSLTPADLTAVGYVISTTSHPVTEVAMVLCHLHDVHIRALLNEVSYNKLKFIKKIHFQGNNIGAAGAAALADGLKSCNNLQELWLSNNNIGAAGAAALADGLMFCNKLQELWFSGNNIGAEGAAALADGLKSCNNLKELVLSDNNIGGSGAAALADGLKSCNNLQTLALSSNNIGADGAAALADGLKFCNNLQTLVLHNNDIGDDGAAALRAHLKCNVYCSAITFLPEEYF